MRAGGTWGVEKPPGRSSAHNGQSETWQVRRAGWGRGQLHGQCAQQPESGKEREGLGK